MFHQKCVKTNPCDWDRLITFWSCCISADFITFWQRSYRARLTNTVTSLRLWAAHLLSLPLMLTEIWLFPCRGMLWAHGVTLIRQTRCTVKSSIPFKYTTSSLICIVCGVEKPHDALDHGFQLQIGYASVSSLAPLQSHSPWQTVSFCSRIPHSHVHHSGNSSTQFKQS